jgi:hypothetical protein
MRWAVGIVLVAVAIVCMAVVANATGDRTLRYRTEDGRVLVVRGEGCFSQEDVTRLRLVEYDGPDRVVYRCVTP